MNLHEAIETPTAPADERTVLSVKGLSVDFWMPDGPRESWTT